MKTIQLYYDIVCPYAYMASQKIEAIAIRHHATIEWIPILLGGIYKHIQSEQVPSASWAPSKMRLGLLDLQREAEIQNIPLQKPSSHPQRSVNAQRLLCAIDDTKRAALTHDLYAAYWQRGEDITDPNILRSYAQTYGVFGDIWTDDSIKQKLFANTEQAIQKGAFGVPFVVIDDKHWWGQDRLHFVDAYLKNPDGIDSETRTKYWPEATLQDQSIHFYHDFASPFSYLGHTQLQNIVKKYNVNIIYKPILLGALFRNIGTPNVPIFAMSKPKQRYMMRDLHEWATWWNVDFSFPKIFPMRTVLPLRISLIEPKITSLLYRAYWVDGRDIGNAQELEQILNEHGFDGTKMIQNCADPKIKEQLIENGKEAEQYGICGVPTMRVKDEIWWGQDRLKSMILSLQKGSS